MRKRTTNGEITMTRTIRARVTHGNLALLEPLNLPDGSEVDITVATVTRANDTAVSRAATGGSETTTTAEEIIRSTSGAWADLLDCEEFERAVYDRRRHHRSPVQL